MTRAWALIGLTLASLGANAAPPLFDHPDSPPLISLSPVAVQKQLELGNPGALDFAVAAPLAAAESDGAWDEPSPGLARWRLRIGSTGARSLSLQVRNLRLPPGAELWLYDRGGHDVQGPITTSSAGSAWLPLVRSDELQIEATMPAAARAGFGMRIEQAFHGFRDVAGRSWPLDPSSGTGNGASGLCNLDVSCPAGDSWRSQVRAAVMITIAGTRLCSGTLVNNSAQDDRPLVLTANHCGITDQNVTSTIVYFNVQRSACAGGVWGSLFQNLRGKTLLSSARSGSKSDFALIELASRPPDSFDVYYSGFDARGAVPVSGVGIHHPSGDDKKISRFDAPASAANDVCIGSGCGSAQSTGFLVDAWAINWSQGTTEGGSSGSGLWNQGGDLVGSLSGGRSECVSLTQNNGGTDYYTRLDKAWSQVSAPTASGAPLRAALDPAGTGCLRVAGKNPGPADPMDCTPTSPVVPPNAAGGGSSDSGGGGGGSLDLTWLAMLGIALLVRRGTLGRKKAGSP